MDITGDASIELPLPTVEAYGKSELSFSLYHLLSVSFFLKETQRIENEFNGSTITSAEENAHRSCVIGGIMSIIASLEATINEFLIEAKDSQEKWLKQITVLLNNWEIIESGKTFLDLLKNKNILEKYQMTCRALRIPTFKAGENPYQDIAHFIELRNALVHYKPEWSEAPKISAKLEDNLRNDFSLNPFSKSSRFFPTKCLSHGCIKWGLDRCESFIREFYAKIGQPQRYKIRKVYLTQEDNPLIQELNKIQ